MNIINYWNTIVNRIISINRRITLHVKFYFYRILKINRIPTFTSKEELWTLYYHMNHLPKGSIALEIGSYLGASACYMAIGLLENEGHLYCVDTWNNETMPEVEGNTFEEFLKNTALFRKCITTIKNNSFNLTRKDFSVIFDLAFIDGDHSYEAVKNDFLLVDQITKKGSKVFFHDHRYFEGVSRVIGEALSTGDWAIGGLKNNIFWIIKTKNLIC